MWVVGYVDDLSTDDLRIRLLASKIVDDTVSEAKGAAILEASGLVGLGAKVGLGLLAAESAGEDTLLVYSNQVEQRMAEDPLFHGFPSLLDPIIVRDGFPVQISSSYIEYELLGNINGVEGVYQIGGQLIDGVLYVTHHFFQPF